MPGRLADEPAALAASIECLREGLQVLSPEWRYLYVNEAVARHGKRTPEELLGHTMLECYPGIEHTEMFKTLERCMRERQSAEIVNEFVYGDGTRGWFELRIEPCPEGLIVLSVDVTERKRLERSLAEAHKLRALGQMASGVAHDLKNILNPLGIQVALLKRRLRDQPRVLETLDQMSEVLKRGAETLDLLRDFGRQDAERPAQQVDLTGIAREAIALCRPRAAQHSFGIELEAELAETGAVLATGADVLSAAVNLLVNAIDALEQGGRVNVRTWRDESAAWLSVTDDGPGMPPEVETRAFEPFFSTKAEAGGGLGLAIVYAVAARNGGEASIRTAPGAGTTVTLRFRSSATLG